MKIDEELVFREIMDKLLAIDGYHQFSRSENPKRVMVSPMTFHIIREIICRKFGFMEVARPHKTEQIYNYPINDYTSKKFERCYVEQFLKGYDFIINEQMADFEFAIVYKIGDYK